MGDDPMRDSPAGADRAAEHPTPDSPAGADRVGGHPTRHDPGTSDREREWAALGEWLTAPPLLHNVDLDVVRERLVFVGRARASLAALEAELVSEVARREGDAAAEEMLRRDQKRSRSGARKAVKTAAQLEWAPNVAEKLAAGAITPEAAGLILDAEGPVDQRQLLAAAEEEPEDRFRRTLKEHINERTTEAELQERRERQRRRRRASISEQSDGMFHLFAQFDPFTGAQVRAALLAKSDELFRSEDPKQRSTPPQRFADALAGVVRTGAGTDTRGGAGADGGADAGRAGNATGAGGGVPTGFELIVLADYDLVHERITNARLTDETRLTEAETLAVACDAKILPGIFNKHTGTIVLGRSQRKISKRLRKRLIARDGGCIGCGAHEKICQGHHVDHWCDDGETSYENTCLLCWRCHHIRVHRHGEQVIRHPDGTYTLAPPVDSRARAGPRTTGGLGGPAVDRPAGRPDPEPGSDPPNRHPARNRPDSPTPHVPGVEPPGVPGHAKPHGREPGRTRGHHSPTSGHRRGSPDTPEPSRTSPPSLPFPASRTETAPDAQHLRAARTVEQTTAAPAGTTV